MKIVNYTLISLLAVSLASCKKEGKANESGKDSLTEKKDSVVIPEVHKEYYGIYTGEFAGIPATGRQVRVPFCVVYDLAGDRISRGRVYMEMPVMMRQLGGAAQPAAAAHA